MLQGLGVDDSMSNLTSAISMEASISSSNTISEMANSAFNVFPTQNLHAFASSNNNNNNNNNNNGQAQPAPSKKRRNLPGHPADPDAEVVALSPRSLMATNRFVCEICNKGFQRDQNLQLHRRGHNLPWKLKQRNKAEAARKKVYVCPEVGCVHHEASRALGDLTGIKKHYSRKHGEKKWKCEKCSKRYAVHSDCKAHSKICGTREYRCDCGTLFSRRDSFITHRAFCDALAQESSKSMAQQNPLFLPTQTAPNNSTTTFSQQTHILNFNNFHPPLNLTHHHNQLKQENHQGLISLPPWLSTDPTRVESSIHQNLINPNGSSSNNSNNISLSTPFSSSTSASLMSATALLQKAAQMGVTMSGNKAVAHQSPPPDWNLMSHMGAQGFCASATSPAGGAAGCLLPSSEVAGNNSMGMGESDQHVFGNKGGANVTRGCMQQQIHNVDMVSTSLPSTSGGGGFDGSGLGFEDGFEEILNANKRDLGGFRGNAVRLMMGSGKEGGGGGGASASGLTRDFLGLRTFPDDRDFLNMAALDEMGSGPYDHHHQQVRQNQGPWQS